MTRPVDGYTLELAAKVCEKRAQKRADESMYVEPDTGAAYYPSYCRDVYNAMDEEDDDCAAAIRALAPPSSSPAVPQEGGTPRTDALDTQRGRAGTDLSDDYVAMREHAKRLERELQAALMVQRSTIEDTSELVRYGIRWAGPREPIADHTLPGGYWTPWHIAQQALLASESRAENLAAALEMHGEIEQQTHARAEQAKSALLASEAARRGVEQALREAQEWASQIAGDERVTGWVHQESYGLYCLLADCPVDFDAALSQSQAPTGDAE